MTTKREEQIKKGARFGLALSALLLAVLLLAVTCFAWFVSSVRPSAANGLNVVTASNTLYFGDTFTIVRTLRDEKDVVLFEEKTTYKKSKPMSYCLVDNKTLDFIKDKDGKVIPAQLRNLIPGETLDFSMTVWQKPNTNSAGLNFSLGLGNLMGDTFSNKADDKPDKPIYSVLGLYRAGLLHADGSEVNPDIKNWLADYGPQGVSPTVKKEVKVIDGQSWDSATKETDGSFLYRFRLTIDTTQYNDLKFNTQNAISEATINIGSLFLREA